VPALGSIPERLFRQTLELVVASVGIGTEQVRHGPPLNRQYSILNTDGMNGCSTDSCPRTALTKFDSIGPYRFYCVTLYVRGD
jgi:hypothetical protein